jgi:hypothetical protein
MPGENPQRQEADFSMRFSVLSWLKGRTRIKRASKKRGHRGRGRRETHLLPAFNLFSVFSVVNV